MGVQIVPGAPGPNDSPGAPSTGQLPSAPLSTVAAPNTAVTATYAAVPGQRHRLTLCSWSYSAAPTAGRLTVVDGATTVVDVDIAATGQGALPLPPGGIVGTTNQAMVVTLAAAGAAVVGKLATAKLTA